MKRLGWLVLLFLEVCMAGSRDADAGEGRTPPPAEIMDTAAPRVTLEADPEYLVGFPMVVAVTLTNATEGTTWMDLPGFGLLSATVPVQFTLVGAAGGRRSELPTRSLHVGEGPAMGFTLKPGTTRTMIFDLTELAPPATPGDYTLEAAYLTRNGTYPAAPATIRIVAPSLEDGVNAGRLRAAQDAAEPSWSRFLDEGRANLPEVDFSPDGWRALAFHEAVHRAIYGRQPLKSVDPALFDGFKTGPLAGEAALMRLELWLARGDARADRLKEKIPAQWPGLTWRVEDILAGQGWLAGLRRTVGAEK